MRKLLTALLIIGSLTGLEASHHCPCKPKVTKEMKQHKKDVHHAANKRAKKAFKEMKHREKLNKEKCHCTGVFQTHPIDRMIAFDGKVKRDSSGNRI